MKRWAYYNEIEPFCVEWLRRLIKAGSIPDGYVDDRSIHELTASDLSEFHEVHLFAGIGLWAKAVRSAGFPEDVQVWTGSCPCQPFSIAGKQEGFDDERHLWPEMHRLLAQRTPAVVFGEQVAGADGLEWLARVRDDLEATGYAVGAADLPAASVGSPQRRQRLFWGARFLANSGATRLSFQQFRELQSAGWGAERRAVEQSGGGACATWSPEFHTFPDGSLRRFEPGLRIVADARDATHRVGRIKAYGNAINPEVASRFVKAFTLT